MSKNNSKRDILVTNALPYANGDLHLGHILEHIQSDIWVRYQRLQGNNCTYICGDCLLYTSPSPRDYAASRMPSSA